MKILRSFWHKIIKLTDTVLIPGSSLKLWCFENRDSASQCLGCELRRPRFSSQLCPLALVLPGTHSLSLFLCNLRVTAPPFCGSCKENCVRSIQRGPWQPVSELSRPCAGSASGPSSSDDSGLPSGVCAGSLPWTPAGLFLLAFLPRPHYLSDLHPHLSHQTCRSCGPGSLHHALTRHPALTCSGSSLLTHALPLGKHRLPDTG